MRAGARKARQSLYLWLPTNVPDTKAMGQVRFTALMPPRIPKLSWDSVFPEKTETSFSTCSSQSSCPKHWLPRTDGNPPASLWVALAGCTLTTSLVQSFRKPCARDHKQCESQDALVHTELMVGVWSRPRLMAYGSPGCSVSNDFNMPRLWSSDWVRYFLNSFPPCSDDSSLPATW